MSLVYKRKKYYFVILQVILLHICIKSVEISILMLPSILITIPLPIFLLFWKIYHLFSSKNNPIDLPFLCVVPVSFILLRK